MNKYIQSNSVKNYKHTNNNNNVKPAREKIVRTNWKIKAQKCRVLEQGKEPQILSLRDAIDYAQKLNLDLVEVFYDYKTSISICKVYDYGKYMYEAKQREKQAKKQARANMSELKCLKISLTTDTADFNRIIEHAKEFLSNGDRVKIILKFRGKRELQNIDMGKNIINGMISSFNGLAVIDQPVTLNGKELSCVLRKN